MLGRRRKEWEGGVVVVGLEEKIVRVPAVARVTDMRGLRSIVYWLKEIWLLGDRGTPSVLIRRRCRSADRSTVGARLASTRRVVERRWCLYLRQCQRCGSHPGGDGEADLKMAVDLCT